MVPWKVAKAVDLIRLYRTYAFETQHRQFFLPIDQRSRHLTPDYPVSALTGHSARRRYATNLSPTGGRYLDYQQDDELGTRQCYAHVGSLRCQHAGHGDTDMPPRPHADWLPDPLSAAPDRDFRDREQISDLEGMVVRPFASRLGGPAVHAPPPAQPPGLPFARWRWVADQEAKLGDPEPTNRTTPPIT